MNIEDTLKEVRKQILVVDIETSSFYPNGKEVNIHTNSDDYIKNAEVKWLGLYSYRDNKTYIFNHNDSLAEAINLLSSHRILAGHNLADFDFPILKNNDYIEQDAEPLILDTMVILGKSSFFNKQGWAFKGRGSLMDLDFDSNSLRSMAEVMKLEAQKGEIDYRIFQKYQWDTKETKQIIDYLTSDVIVVKQMIDRLWEYWKPFTEFLPQKSINDLSWIRGSIASVIYKSCCHLLGEEPTYSDRGEKAKESMGGNVIEPVMEEAKNVWYVDFASLYPHLMVCFNIFSEVPSSVQGTHIWHGNSLFQVKGHYDTARPHPLSKIVTELLKKRLDLKKNDPKNPMVYTYKIFLNGLYGVVRSSIFEKVHKPSAGWDICWLGQQCQKLLMDMMLEFGFKTIAGDTDSLFLIAIDEKNNNEIYVKECLKKVIDKILVNAPFKVETFSIAIEKYIDYITWPFELQAVQGEDGKNIKVKNRLVKERKGTKKNYLYLYTDKEGKKQIEIKGLPLIKNNSTGLGYKIYEDVLKNKILSQGHAKFPKSEIDAIINDYLSKPDALELIAQEYKVKPAKSYKTENNIQAQISNAYFGSGDGVIKLIKNNLIGDAGKGKVRYCSIPQAKEVKLSIVNLDLTKLYNEVAPFIKYEEPKLDTQA